MIGWAAFISGRGSTVQALFDVQDEIDLRLVISSRKLAYGLKRAQRAGIPTLILEKNFSWEEVDFELRRRGIQRIFLLGFMRIIPPDFTQKWIGRIWNIHPSLLPKYPGLHAMEKSHQDKSVVGITIHDVNADLDSGQARMRRSVVAEGSNLSFAECQLRMAVEEQAMVRDWARRSNWQGCS